MPIKILWKIQYINLCVSQFAKANKMTQQLSYRYLREYKGIDFLYNNYEAEHVLPLSDTLKSLKYICKRNGGNVESHSKSN